MILPYNDSSRKHENISICVGFKNHSFPSDKQEYQHNINEPSQLFAFIHPQVVNSAAKMAASERKNTLFFYLYFPSYAEWYVLTLGYLLCYYVLCFSQDSFESVTGSNHLQST